MGRSGHETSLRRSVALPGHWTRTLVLAIAGLIALGYASQVFRSLHVDFPGLDSLERLFYYDLEANVPTWFSSILLFLCAERAWRVASAARACGDRWHRHWRGLAVIFAYLSLDELVQLHEQVVVPLRAALTLDGALRFAWVVIAVPLVVVFAVVYLRFLVAQPLWTRVAFVVSGVVYVGAAAGMELIGGLVVTAFGFQNLLYATASAVEEGAEMLGAVLFLGALTTSLARMQRRAAATTASASATDHSDGPLPSPDTRDGTPEEANERTDPGRLLSSGAGGPVGEPARSP
ncbi:hypothetical protein PROP_01141 [Propionicimonas sp. T2.31MG-18]|uniref:hypothetical protein n=1 Tax=Propionicimonas sp. T2.31MG-18 TaxID=3157620 RepID=UPI0035EF9137